MTLKKMGNKNLKKDLNIEVSEFPYCCCDGKNNNIQKKNLKLRSISNPRVSYITNGEWNKLNIFLRSIVGISYLNLAQYNKTFKVVFPDRTNTEIQNYINAKYPGFNIKLTKWTTPQITNVLSAYGLITDFLGVKLEASTIFDTADFVICLVSGINGGGDASFPWELDFYTETNNKLYIFLSTEYVSYSWNRGTYYYSLIMHLICHTLGLAHTYDNGNNSEIMPGADFQSGEIGQGLSYSNNNLSTLMTRYQVIPSSFEKDATVYSRTLMSLDLQALRFYYKVGNNPTYIQKWIDFNGPIGVTQTMVTPDEGGIINLVQPPTLEFSIYNLNLYPLEVAPYSGKNTPYDLMSSYNLGYGGNNINYFTTYTTNFIDINSKIIRVKSNYTTTNIFAGVILNDLTVELDTSKKLGALIYLNGRSSDYSSLIGQSDTFEITNLSSLKKITFLDYSKILFVYLYFSINE